MKKQSNFDENLQATYRAVLDGPVVERERAILEQNRRAGESLADTLNRLENANPPKTLSIGQFVQILVSGRTSIARVVSKIGGVWISGYSPKRKRWGGLARLEAKKGW